jgi:hypothetical protein
LEAIDLLPTTNWSGSVEPEVDPSMPDTDPHGRDVPIAELLCNLRDALSGLAAIAERTGLSWRDGEAYDEWDGLAAAVYHAFVAETLIPTSDPPKDVLPLAPYDMVLPTYAEQSSIAVATQGGEQLLFNKLLAGKGTFDSAEVIETTPAGLPLDRSPISVPLGSCSWHLLRRSRDTQTVEVVGHASLPDRRRRMK